MTMAGIWVRVLPVLLALAGTLLAARLAGMLAARLRQPPVVAEIAAGMVIGFAVSSQGPAAHRLLSPLKLIGEAALTLFLVGAAHEIRTGLAHGHGAASRKEIGWVAAGAFVIPFAAGLSLAGWVIVSGGRLLRGTAPTSSFVLLTAVALGVTAVPVLARILADRNLAASRDGQLAVAAAIVIDAVSWPLLAAAIAVRTSTAAGMPRPLVVLAIGAAAAGVLHVLLRTSVAGRLCARTPQAVPVVIAVVALAAAATTEHYGLTEILGAVLVGLVIPPGGPAVPWSDSVRAVARSGRFLVPVYFVVTGMTVLTGPSGARPWAAILIGTVLALVSKVGGGYLGSRRGGRPHRSGLRVGVLMSTRGLTEIVVLQAGYSAGILTTALYSALVVMALVTTALTVPLLSVIDRRWGGDEPLPHPDPAMEVTS